MSLAALASANPVRVTGSLTRVIGLEAEAKGIRASLGDLVWIETRHGSVLDRVCAQVVAVREDALLLAPFGSLEGVAPGARVEPAGTGLTMTVGAEMAGRVIDALGRPIDGLGPIRGEQVLLENRAPHPLKRQRIAEILPLGVRCVDTMLTCGRGQRVGIFAGSGVGKSTLLGMMARGTSADMIVVGLVGERGREVREFLEDDLGAHGRERVCAVVATSDESPLMRLRAAYTATRVAEHFRDQGLDVLLLVDSLTRFAMAQREIGLAAGEPPATRGFPPSVFAELPRLLERAGPGERGSITALYTVLVEGDDMNDPVADHARSILDGHVVLSRRLAAAGHFPTIDVLHSVSRLTSKICSPEQRDDAAAIRRLLSAYDEARELIEIGAYSSGADPWVDRAIELRELTTAFLQQPLDVVTPAETAWAQLHELAGLVRT